MDSNGNDSNNNTRLLWISGGRGKGKTILSVFLKEVLEMHTARVVNGELVFFFCTEDEKRNTAIAVLRGLVHQIITKRPHLVKHMLPYFETSEMKQPILSSLESRWLIFVELVTDAELGTMFCMIDGLDEGVEERTPRVLFLQVVDIETSLSSKGTLRLVIVSREILRLHDCLRIRLDHDNNEKVDRDIKLFISARVEELSMIHSFNDNSQAFIQKHLLAHAEDTFLWVGYVVQELLQKRTNKEIQEALTGLPSGLLAIYQRMLLQIPATPRELSRAILEWVAIAGSPLTLQQLAGAVRFQASPSHITVEQSTRDAVVRCGSFLKMQGQEIRLVHQSTRGYLLRKERDTFAVLEVFRFEPHYGHYELTRVCLNCITQSDLVYQSMDLETTSTYRGSPLLLYAVVNWPVHANQCPMFATQLFEYAQPFFKEDSPLRNHLWAAYSGFKPSNQSALYMACSSGVLPWVEAIISENIARKSLLFKRRNWRKADILITKEVAAAATRNESSGKDVLRLLFDQKGANIPVTKEVVAAAGGNKRSGKEILRFLFDQQGANIPITKEVVAAAWNKEVMTLLFDRKGADIPITKEAVVAAVGNEGRGNEVVFLVDNEPDFHNTKQQAQSTGLSWKDSRYLDESTSTVFSSEEEKLTEATSACDSHTFPVFQPPGGDFEGDDNASVASYDTFEMTPDEDLEVIAYFTDALCERACDPGFLLNKWSMLFDILQVKIKKFSQTVQKDNPWDVIELNPKRKIAKATYRFRRPILNGFVRRLLVGDQRSTSTEPESIQQKPLLGYDIPLEPIEQKIQRMESIVVGSQAPLFGLNHEHEADSESSDSSDCHSLVLQTRPDFVALHGYFKNHPAFGALTSDIQRLMKHFQYDALEHIRQGLSRITRNTSKPTALTAETFKVQFHADWDLVGFLEERRSHALDDDLSSVFTITGHTQAAQLETVAKFVLQTWDIQLNVFLPALQKATSDPYNEISFLVFPDISDMCIFSFNTLIIVSHSDEDFSGTRVVLEKGRVSVSTRWVREFRVAVAKQLAWLGATCRPNEQQQQPSDARRYPYYCDTVWNSENSESDTFSVSYVTVPIDEAEPLPSWTSLLDRMCIASGYSINERLKTKSNCNYPQNS